MKFRRRADGTITGLRYYKSAQDIGTHTGSLWTSTGTLLANATFTNESARGWQTVTFTQPISGFGRYNLCRKLPLQRLLRRNPEFLRHQLYERPADGAVERASGGNGVYAYGSSCLFPTASFNATNYWVDVLYEQVNGNLAPDGR